MKTQRGNVYVFKAQTKCFFASIFELPIFYRWTDESWHGGDSAGNQIVIIK